MFHSGVRGHNRPGCGRTDRALLRQGRAGQGWAGLRHCYVAHIGQGSQCSGPPSGLSKAQDLVFRASGLHYSSTTNCVAFGKLPSFLGLSFSICKLKPTSHGEDCVR